ncbi:hypothetical protein KC959_01080, partial [Candidatus Saccharibacteria bacterium]|nr:hypothetical protein [Candidatus Saccharibacteria bacterium]
MDEQQTTGGTPPLPENNEPQSQELPVQQPQMNQSPVPEQMAEPMSAPRSPMKSAKPKWFLPAILLAILLLGGGAAAYVKVFQKSPESLWKSALANTADGIQEYLDASFARQNGALEFNGSFKLTSPVAADGSVNGQWQGQKGYVKLDVGAAGSRINAEVRALPPEGSETPDIFINVDGLDGIVGLLSPLAGSEASQQISTANGQWYVIDHTLLDQYATKSDDKTSLDISSDDVKAISDKVMTVLRAHVFTDDETKAVFEIVEKYGKEDFEGMSTYKMLVRVNKENFKSFLVDLKEAVKDTKLADLMKSGQDDKTLEEALDFENLLSEIDNADFSNMQADVWVEAGGRFVRNVRLYPVKDKKDTNYLDIGLNYSGGDVLPFVLKATIDDDGDKGTTTFGLEVNQKSADLKATLDV